MGADRAILLTDRSFAGADTWATSHALGSALKKLAPFDLVLCGRQAIDGDTAQVGPEVAEFLDLPQMTYVREVDVEGDTLRVKRSLEDGYEVLETEMPALLTVVKDLNLPRLPSMIDIMNAYEKEIETWHAEDIDVDRDKIGLRGSPTRIRRAGTPELKQGNVEFLTGPADEVAQKLLAILEEKHLV